jgi:glutathione reductase (NADPH)
MAQYDYDLFVIGGGSGGVRAARMVAGMGARVGLAEESRMGGTCVIRGCIPKKLFAYASRFADAVEDARGYGWDFGQGSFDWSRLMANKDREIARLEGLYTANAEKAGVEIFHDRAVFENDHTLLLVNKGRKVTARTILIATGNRPVHNLIAGHEVPGEDLCITSNDAFRLKACPARIVIVGGGYVALEFAHIFHGLGAKVTLVYRGEKPLRGFDDALRDALCESMLRVGIDVRLNCQITSVEKHAGHLVAHTINDKVIACDQVMLAIGRLPNTGTLGLDKAGVGMTRNGAVQVDAYSRTSVPHIYAVGDVTDRMQLTPVAIHEAMCFVATVFADTPTRPDHVLVPSAVFTTPEVATVGLSEAEALAQGHAIDVYQSSFRPLMHALSGRNERALMKLVVDQGTDRVLGCHVFGEHAAEIVQMAAVALRIGATKRDFDATIALHPTAAEELVTMRTKSYSRAPTPPV